MPDVNRQCTVSGCTNALDSRGLCNMHVKRMRRNGTTESRLRYPRVEIPIYRGMHDRVKAQRGRASNHPCVDCGNPARHWTYNHTGKNEIVDTRTGLTYSTIISDYEPRCTVCHRRFDMPHRPAAIRTPRGTFA